MVRTAHPTRAFRPEGRSVSSHALPHDETLVCVSWPRIGRYETQNSRNRGRRAAHETQRGRDEPHGTADEPLVLADEQHVSRDETLRSRDETLRWSYEVRGPWYGRLVRRYGLPIPGSERLIPRYELLIPVYEWLVRRALWSISRARQLAARSPQLNALPSLSVRCSDRFVPADRPCACGGRRLVRQHRLSVRRARAAVPRPVSVVTGRRDRLHYGGSTGGRVADGVYD